MTDSSLNELSRILERDSSEILAQWVREQTSVLGRAGSLSDTELTRQCTEFLKVLRTALASGSSDIASSAWSNVREMLTDISRTRARQGFTPTETASFILALKRP